MYIDDTDFQKIILDLIGSEEKLDVFFNTTTFSNENEEIKEKCRSAMIYGITIAALHTCKCEGIIINNKDYINKNELIKWLEGNKFINIDEKSDKMSRNYEKEFAWELSRNTFINKIINFLTGGKSNENNYSSSSKRYSKSIYII